MNESVSDFLSANREEISFPISVSVEPDKNAGSLRRRDTGRLIIKEQHPTLNGEVKFLKSDKVEFIVPFIRIGESYLAGEGRLLNTKISLPNGNVQMQLIGESYEQVGKHTSVAKFLITAKIVYMSQTDKDLFQSHLDSLSFSKTTKPQLALHITQR